MAIAKRSFGVTSKGQEVALYTLVNSKGMKAEVTDYGAILVNLFVPDKNGNVEDVVLGFDSVEGYEGNPSFFGATIGPNANRIANAKFSIDGTEYQLDVNDGPNNLHSHKDLGYHKLVWKVTAEGENSITFTMIDEDGYIGFPGNKETSVTYILDDENGLTISYAAKSDKKTILNPTNHTYFNLDGHASGSIEDHIMQLNASNYTPIVAGAIPTGEIAPVAGNPMDFTQAKAIGKEINADMEQLILTGGYDHNWVVDGWDGTLRKISTLVGPKSGRIMHTYTDLPGVQFYAGNFIDEQDGKNGVKYGRRMGLCLETQYYPNTINIPDFPSCVFGEDNDYKSVTVYRFE